MHARVSGQTLNGFRWDVNMGLFDICGTLSVFLGGGRSLPAQPTSELLLCSFLQLPVHIPHLPGCVCVGQDKRGHNLELLLHVQYSECYKIAVQRFPPWVLSHCFTRDERGTHFSAFWVNVSLIWFHMNSNKVTVNIKVNCDQILSLSLQVTPSSADAGVCAQQQKRVSLSAVIIQVVKCRNTWCSDWVLLLFSLLFNRRFICAAHWHTRVVLCVSAVCFWMFLWRTFRFELSKLFSSGNYKQIEESNHCV